MIKNIRHQEVIRAVTQSAAGRYIRYGSIKCNKSLDRGAAILRLLRWVAQGVVEYLRS